MPAIPQFFIAEEFLTDIAVTKEVEFRGEGLVEILGTSVMKGTMHSTEDHPEFSKLREHLGQEGYIRIERTYWNGDRVLKPFKLNGYFFKKNDQFSCATALRYKLAPKKVSSKKTSARA